MAWVAVSISPGWAQQDSRWREWNDQGQTAFRQGRFAESERLLKAALKEAERFGSNDERLATSLDNLAWLAYKQGRYVHAIPLEVRGCRGSGRRCSARCIKTSPRAWETWP